MPMFVLVLQMLMGMRMGHAIVIVFVRVTLGGFHYDFIVYRFMGSCPSERAGTPNPGLNRARPESLEHADVAQLVEQLFRK